MPDETYILGYDGECDGLERQSPMSGHDRGGDMAAPTPRYWLRAADRGGFRG